MKHSKFITWLSAAFLGISFAAFSPSAAASAESENGFVYSCDTDTKEATITGYEGSASDVKIPDRINGYKVTAIGEKAFSNKRITSVDIPATVRTINNKAFAFCRYMTSADIEGAARIDELAFAGCSSLTDLSFSDDVPYIGVGAFLECTALDSVTIPAGVTVVDQLAFNSCSSLTSLTVLGDTALNANSFRDCISLSEVQLSDDSRTVRRHGFEAFYNCPSLYKVNGADALQYKTDENGIQYPVINPAIKTAVTNHFCRSIKVGFVDDYCTKLCKYIVKTETGYDSEHPETNWMNDGLKARQLHNWLIRHCEFEDSKNGESNSDSENQIASSVFLSYALNVRGNGVGESVCAGYARAYTMLLATAGIESYYIQNDQRGWNIVKIGDKFYHTDVPSDEGGNSGIRYSSFLKSTLRPKSNAKQYILEEHTLLTTYKNDISDIIENCTESYKDENGDGILDYDFDLDGKSFQYDFIDDLNAYQGLLRFAFGSLSSTDQINDRMAEVFGYLCKYNMDFWTYLDYSCPKPQTVRAGGTAEFRVTLFGDDLTYQWQYYNKNSGAWENAPYNGATGATLYVPANSTTDKMEFKCFVYNKNQNYIYSYPVMLKVV